MIHDGRRAVVVDPGDAAPVIEALHRAGLTLAAILVTHWHPDHVGGLATLLAHPGAAGCVVRGPADEPMPVPLAAAHDGEHFAIAAPALAVETLRVPGHTRGHLAYRVTATGPGADPADPGWLFCGDTLFSAGCGRLFEGTAAQMHASLGRLMALDPAIRVCCTHEYTLSNLRFARAVEPGNAEIARHEAACQSLRAQGLPTLPTSIGRERQINPFVRCDQPEVIASAVGRGADGGDPEAVFAALRLWKDEFR